MWQLHFTAYPIIQAPPVTKTTTGFRPSFVGGMYKSSLPNHWLHLIHQSYAIWSRYSTDHLYQKAKREGKILLGSQAQVPIPRLISINYTPPDLGWEKIKICNYRRRKTKLVLVYNWKTSFLLTRRNLPLYLWAKDNITLKKSRHKEHCITSKSK